MPRHNERVALRVRYRVEGKHHEFNTHFVLSSHDPTKGIAGRRLQVGKVSFEEANKVGEFWRPFRDNDPESLALRRLVNKPVDREPVSTPQPEVREVTVNA